MNIISKLSSTEDSPISGDREGENDWILGKRKIRRISLTAVKEPGNVALETGHPKEQRQTYHGPGLSALKRMMTVEPAQRDISKLNKVIEPSMLPPTPTTSRRGGLM